MSGLEAISYSQDETITAIRNYYQFLTKSYLHEAYVVEPPSGGWPHIDNLQCMEKTDEVIDLLRHLPYIRRTEDDGPQGAPGCHFADWQQISQAASEDDGCSMRECSEPSELVENIPPHVIGLTYGGRNNPTFLLDTQRGIVHWYECDDEIRHNADNDPEWVMPVTDVDDPYEWAPEEEAEWRAEHPAWAVADFFHLLQRQFLRLKFVPISPKTVYEVHDQQDSEEAAMLSAVQDIYRQHGWPNLATFRKQECLQAVGAILRTEYPDHLDPGPEDDDRGEDEE
ncbi:uncharacterized protein BCR38DRAFT_432119 [Pseudomassariella vexata]|uniref:Uncharacterized protein n=1 Tax=Pseudomassariella vexata TaxID=1141098 RepID=A0A1Y2E0Y8_9PEZI|nr:uncharacterized protein BCR38DRAFT_432119 [Pseudomassariella vexata]ORY65200.1 hypothetical protein BCR38DRAFT_432119 [Pseudomassariella vexata]